MQNTIDFLRESAIYMAKDRPDVYNNGQEALIDLTEMMEKMREYEGSTWTSFTSFMLIKNIEEFDDDDNVEEWFFVRKISSLAVFPSEGEVQVFGHTGGSGTLKVGVNLTGPDDQDLEL